MKGGGLQINKPGRHWRQRNVSREVKSKGKSLVKVIQSKSRLKMVTEIEEKALFTFL